MARRIKLTRDERIMLKAAIVFDGEVPDFVTSIPEYRRDALITKLQHRGLLSGRAITDEGLRAMVKSRQTAPS